MKKTTIICALFWGCLSVPAFANFLDAKMNLKYQQYAAAESEFSALAEKGNAAANYYLGYMHQNGLGVPKSITNAYHYFKKADELNYLPASAQLGKMLLSGEHGIPGSYNDAVMLLKKAALAGNSEAAYELGNLYLTGAGTGENAIVTNYNNAFGYFLLASLKGNAKAQLQLSKMYLVGRGVPQDYNKARTWITRSANQGYVKAQVELAAQLESDPRMKNLPDAYAWYSILAAYNSDAVGTMAAGKRDALGKKLKKKTLAQQQTLVRQWKPKKAEQSVPAEERNKTALPVIQGFNDPNTLQHIIATDGMWPMDGKQFGVTQDMLDLAAATRDFSELDLVIDKAMKRKVEHAGSYYGDVLSKQMYDEPNAFKWYKRAAEDGDVYGQFQLAKFYCEGRVVDPDAGECYALFLSVQKAHDPVLNILTQQALMTVRANALPEELERGQQILKDRETKQEKEEKDAGLLDFL